MFRSIFIGLLVVAVLGCQTRPESTSTVSERALWTIPPSDANFEEWEAPSTLLGLAFMGDVANAEHQRRVLYYENDEKTALEVKLMPNRKSTRLNSSHVAISYAVFCLNKKK